MYRTKLNVKGMYCGHCVMQLEGALDEIGAKNIRIDQYTGDTSFETADQPGVSAVVQAVRKYGFEPHDLLIEKESQNSSSGRVF